MIPRRPGPSVTASDLESCKSLTWTQIFKHFKYADNDNYLLMAFILNEAPGQEDSEITDTSTQCSWSSLNLPLC